jgi:hypothetical protein
MSRNHPSNDAKAVAEIVKIEIAGDEKQSKNGSAQISPKHLAALKFSSFPIG